MKIRTKKARFSFPLDDCNVTVEMMTESEKKKFRESFKDEKTGEYNDAEVGRALFRQRLVGLDGVEDEDGNSLPLTPELKETIMEFDPVFFMRIMAESDRIYNKREDLAGKNSMPGANGTLPRKRSKAKE